MKKLLALALVVMMCLSLIPAIAEGTTEGKTEIVVWNQIFEDWNRAWCEEKVAEFNADPNQKYYVTQEFIDYALPLIQGETKLQKENGLPRFAKLKKVLAK